ncbi:hypothetical protein ACVI1J_001963 [Bradyrhizobium diazoefficiens]
MQKASPKRGLLVRSCWLALIVPMMITTDHDAAVVIAVVIVPATVPAAVMLVNARAGAVIIVPVAADIDADAGRIGDGRGTDCKRRYRCKRLSQLLHLFLLFASSGVNDCRHHLLQERARNFLE